VAIVGRGEDVRTYEGLRSTGHRSLVKNVTKPWVGVLLLTLTLLASGAHAQAPSAPLPVDVYVFHGEGCPHCANALAFLGDLQADHPTLTVHEYEVWYDATNRALLEAFAAAYRRPIEGVPILILGDEWWVGFGASTERDLRERIARYEATPAPDPRLRLDPDALAWAIDANLLQEPMTSGPTVATTPVEGETQAGSQEVTLPLLGTIDLTRTPLLLATALIGFVDGVNPCSLWVLALLLGVVLGTGDRRRVLLIGLTFLTITAAAYAVFIAGIFQVMALIGALGWIRIVVALLAAGMAAVNLKDYVAFGQGFSLTTPDAAKPGIYKGIRRIMQAEGSWLLTLGATSLLALGVTLVELPCTAGFPVIWSGLLADAGVGRGGFLGLLGVYMLIYLLDELAIFTVAVVTMRAARLDQGGARILKLVGGMVMLALAIAMLQTPEALGSLAGTTLVFGLALAASGLVVLIHRIVHPASSPLTRR